MKQFQYISIGVLIGALVSCNKFLEVKPKGVVLPEKVADYEGLLNSQKMTETFPAELLYSTDDIQGEFRPSDKSSNASAYYWQSQLDPSTDLPPAIWEPAYRSIYSANVIINYVESAIDGTGQKKEEVLGEGMLVKAECYFTLLTAFAKSYDAATASADPGLPLVNSTNVTDKIPARSSLKESFDELIRLATEASKILPDVNINRLRANKFAAYGLLARAYLYMSDYEKASEFAAKALEAPHEVLDYNTYTRESFPPAELNPEALWVRFSPDYGVPGFMIYTDDLLKHFSSDDLRIPIHTRDPLPVTRIYANGNASFGLTFPEMYMIQAEALARDNKPVEAMAIINDLRKKRIATASYADETAATQEEAIAKVIAERRRELAFTGQRWMDMKRFDHENRMPEIVRYTLGTTDVEATLPPHGKGYTFEIPARVLNFNPGMQKNHN